MTRAIPTIVFFCLGISALRLLLATLLPVLQDETYYILWSKYLDWGYFDHPPGVALLARTSDWGEHQMWDRFGCVLVGAAMIALLAGLLRELGFKSKREIAVGICLGSLSIAGLLAALLVTPDVAMTCAWVGALWMAARALNRNPRWWLLAGLFTGVGLLSKYVMVIIGPVFLWGLVRGAPQQLRSPWPYLGGVVALIIFLPHLQWNAEHDWVTFKFQLMHGLSNSHEISQEFPSPLPLAKKAPIGSNEYLLAQSFVDPEAEEKIPRVPSPWEKRGRRYEELVVSQLALWGFLLVAIMAGIWRAVRQKRWLRAPLTPSRPLIHAATFFPLLTFALVAWNSKVEANWPAIYMIGASALLIPSLVRLNLSVYSAAAANALALCLYAWHSTHPILPIKPDKDRVLRDSAGYSELADYIATRTDLVLFDTYQIGSMLAYYQPSLETAQWPGITRVSEFLRRADLNKIDDSQLQHREEFWLLMNSRVPPMLASYAAVDQRLLTYCLEKGLVVSYQSMEPFKPPCKKQQVRSWYMTKYVHTAGEG